MLTDVRAAESDRFIEDLVPTRHKVLPAETTPACHVGTGPKG